MELLSFTCSASVCLGFGLLCLALIYLYRHFTILKRHGFRGPTPWPLVGNLVTQMLKGIGETDKEWIQKYGKVFGYYSGYRPQVFISDPELLKIVMVKEFPNFTDRPASSSLPALVRNGLFFMQGRRWKKTRNILTPAFSAGKLKLFMPILKKCSSLLSNHLSEHVGEEVDIRKYFIHFTMDAIASTAFGIDIDSQNQPNDPFVANIDPIFNVSLGRRITMLITMALPPLAKLMSKLGLHSWPQKSIAFYEKTGQMLIDERKKNKGSHIDFIQMLLEAELDAGKSEHIQHGQGFELNATQSEMLERLTDYEINAQAFVFFLAGFETTASALRFAAYELALNPDVDARLYEEIQDTLGNSDATYDNVASLKYMDMFLNEVLRYYPPLPRLSRVASKDVKVGDWVIPKGSAIAIPVWSIHHNPEYYPDPDKFDPERFSTDKSGSSNVDKITYLPFGSGPRHCIGMRLALVEAKLALVHVLKKVRFTRCEKTQVPLDLINIGLLRPKNPVIVKLEAR